MGELGSLTSSVRRYTVVTGAVVLGGVGEGGGGVGGDLLGGGGGWVPNLFGHFF